MSYRVLIVEDEADLAQTLRYNFERAGYRVDCAATGAEAKEKFERGTTPDLILLDLMLPDLSGIELCRTIRANARTKHVAVIMVTAWGEEPERVEGFETGADDYVVKPFSVRELLLRAQSLLRRLHASEPCRSLCFGCIRIDQSAHRVWIEDEEISLTALEFRLLSTLANRRGRVQSRERLLEDVWEMQSTITTRTVDTHVKRLRKKLRMAGGYIETLRGVGYRFCANP